MAEYAAQIQTLQQKVEGTRYQFLLAELQTCAIAVDFARWEYERGNTPLAQRELDSVLTGIATLQRFIPDVSEEHQLDVKNKMADLQAGVDSLQQLLHGKSA